MAETLLFTGQGIAKDCVAGNAAMNRYALFNGLELPRRIDENLEATTLGIPQADEPELAYSATAGNLDDTAWYGYVAVWASAKYLRPVAVADGSGNFTRGNPSDAVARATTGANQSIRVRCTAPDNRPDITHVFIYRSLGSANEAAALAGPFYYAGQAELAGTFVDIHDGEVDDLLGVAVETDNYPPNAYRYAIEANNSIFAGGNYMIGAGLTCTVTPGSSAVTLSTDVLYDGVVGWVFKCLFDSSGGINEAGLFYANYVNANTLQLVDENGDEMNYDGALAGAGQEFILYLPGHVLRWSKTLEPEAWPTDNLINFDGDITGLAMIPNQPLLLVCTDRPSMYVLDLSLMGSDSFKTTKRLVSSEYTASSHFSLVAVDGRLRAIDAYKGCIIEVDGTVVRDISRSRIPRIFEYLSQHAADIANWHCAYDQKRRIFGAFVTFRGAHRMIDFCIGQHTLTGEWFFHHEKDLLSTGHYMDPPTGETMVLGGTQGLGTMGAVWGRIWAPDVWDEWIPSGSLRSGTVVSATDTTITVDNASASLHTLAGGLSGRWVLVCKPNGEYAQLAYVRSNTENVLTIDSVYNGFYAERLYPVPEAGWKFYLGLIEMRWGPKKFDFGDPDALKKVWEVWCCVSNHNESDPPFIRLYRGFEQGYSSQLVLYETKYLDRTETQSLANRVSNKLETVPRWGVAWYDRSYGRTELHSLTVIFRRIP